MVKIRLKRMGRKKRPFYRIVVADIRSPRDGKNIEEIGYYNPLLDPPDVKLDLDRVDYWLGVGAKPTNTVDNIIRIQREEQASKAEETEAQTEEAETEIQDDASATTGEELADDMVEEAELRKENKMKDLVYLIAESLVDDPDAIQITENQEDDEVYIELTVAEDDMGKVIGKQGKIAKAIRTVLKAAGIIQDIYVDLKIV